MQWLRVTNVDPYVFTSILQEPLRQLTSLRHVGLVFDSRPAASKDDFSILEVVSNLLSLWLHLNTLFLTRLQDFTLSSAVEPQSIFPTLPKLHTLTLRECRLTDNLLLQLFQSLPNLLHLEIYRPDLTFHKLENMQQALSIVQQSLHTLRLAGWPDALPPKIVAAGLPLLQDLSIETMHLEYVRLYTNSDHQLTRLPSAALRLSMLYPLTSRPYVSSRTTKSQSHKPLSQESNVVCTRQMLSNF